MKYLLIILALMIASLVTACADYSVLDTKPAASAAASSYTPTEIDTNVVKEFIKAVNERQPQTALELFNIDTGFIGVDSDGTQPLFLSYKTSFTYNSKSEIEYWLKDGLAANLQIDPLNYRVVERAVTVNAICYYNNQPLNTRLVAYPQDGKLNLLFIYFEKS